MHEFTIRSEDKMEGKIRLACVVLAAGKSQRFGSNKLLEDMCGRTVLERNLGAVPFEEFEAVNIVTSREEVYIAADRYCRNISKDTLRQGTEKFRCIRYPGGELSDSIRQGLADIGGLDGYMFLNGDQPLLRKSSVRRLLDAFREKPCAIHRLAVEESAASPVIFPKAAYPELINLTGENGGKVIIKSGKYDIILTEAGQAFEIMDVDTPELLEELRRLAASGLLIE